MSTILKTAIITEAPSRIIETKFGERQVLTLTFDNQEEKIWFNANTENSKLKLGETVNLLIDGNKKKIIRNENVAVQPDPITEIKVKNFESQNEKTFQYIGKEKRKEISAFVSENVDLYYFIRSEVANKAKSENLTLDNEDIRATTTSIFISTQRKFNLA